MTDLRGFIAHTVIHWDTVEIRVLVSNEFKNQPLKDCTDDQVINWLIQQLAVRRSKKKVAHLDLCTHCNAPLPKDWELELCPNCEEGKEEAIKGSL